MTEDGMSVVAPLSVFRRLSFVHRFEAPSSAFFSLRGEKAEERRLLSPDRRAAMTGTATITGAETTIAAATMPGATATTIAGPGTAAGVRRTAMIGSVIVQPSGTR